MQQRSEQLLMNRRKFLTRFTLTLGGAALLASYPLWIERQIVLVNTYRIPVPRLPGAFHGFRLVHLTDLHYGFLVSLEFLQSVVKRANRIPRDVTICTGDIVDVRDSSRQIDRVWPLLSHLRAPGGVFSVLGNHDHWADGDRSRFWLRRTGQDLSKKAVCFTRNGQRLWMAGTGDLMEDHVPLDSVPLFPSLFPEASAGRSCRSGSTAIRRSPCSSWFRDPRKRVRACGLILTFSMIIV
ncbi:MAG: metallophosphoesterase [Desulfococcaceae bacterium]